MDESTWLKRLREFSPAELDLRMKSLIQVGDTIRGQMGAMTQELSGQDGSTTLQKASDAGTKAAGTASSSKKLSDYTGQSN